MTGREIAPSPWGRPWTGGRNRTYWRCGHNHAVKRSGEFQVADPRFEPAGLALGDGKIGSRNFNVDSRLREVGLAREQFRLRLGDCGLRPHRARRYSTSTGWSTRARPADRPRPCQPHSGDARPPSPSARPSPDTCSRIARGFVEARLGRLDLGLGHVHQLSGPARSAACRARPCLLVS